MKRNEIVIPAALFIADYTTPDTLVRLDTEHPEHVYLSSLLTGLETQRDEIEAHVSARPRVHADDPFSKRLADSHDATIAHTVPRVYRVRLVAEYEELPADEAARWVADARARDEGRR